MFELTMEGMPFDGETLKGRDFVHFKGKRYRLIDYAKDSESLETMVVYRALYGGRGLWVRPARMFFETIEREGYRGPRFRLADDEG